VWRDPAADFGYDVLGAHLAAHHLWPPGSLALPGYAGQVDLILEFLGLSGHRPG